LLRKRATYYQLVRPTCRGAFTYVFSACLRGQVWSSRLCWNALKLLPASPAAANDAKAMVLCNAPRRWLWKNDVTLDMRRFCAGAEERVRHGAGYVVTPRPAPTVEEEQPRWQRRGDCSA